MLFTKQLQCADTSVPMSWPVDSCIHEQALDAERKEKATPFGVKSIRSQVLYKAAQAASDAHKAVWICPSVLAHVEVISILGKPQS